MVEVVLMFAYLPARLLYVAILFMMEQPVSTRAQSTAALYEIVVQQYKKYLHKTPTRLQDMAP